MRNSADSLVYQTEKTIRENADKLGEEEKTEIEAKLENLKSALENEEIDVETVKTGMEELSLASQGFAQRLYEEAAKEAEQESQTPEEDDSEDIIDAEIIDEEE